MPFGQLSALGKLGRIVNSRVGAEAFIGGTKALLTREDEFGRVEAARITAEESRLAREETAQNFSGAGGLLRQSSTSGFVADPSLPLQAGRWFWNPQTRRLEFQAPALA